MAVWPPSTPPIAQGLPGSSGAATSELLRPLRLVVPIGWMGGKYRTSKPRSAIWGMRAAASRNLALLVGSGPADRGNISYHVLKRARSRSTLMRLREDRVA